MKDKIETVLGMRDLTLDVQNEIIETVGDDFSEIKNSELLIVEDDFVIKPNDNFYNNFYMKINRSSYEVVEVRTYNRYPLNKLNTICETIVNILHTHSTEFDKIFGVKLETIEDFINNVEMLLEAAIERRYVIGKIVPRGYGDSYDEYGIIFDPSCFFSIEYTDEDKKYYGKSKMRCYVEFDKETIEPKDLADFLIKIILKNKETINKYIEEGKDNEKN